MVASLSDDLSRAMVARDRAISWLMANVAADGTPADAEHRNGWMRLSWGLAVAGRTDAGSAVMCWIEKNRLSPEGGFLERPLTGQSYIDQYPNYWLATFVIGAWLVGRTDLAMRSMRWLMSQQDPEGGGLPMRVPGLDGEPVFDLMSTAQVGLAALVAGEHETAGRCADWVMAMAQQSAENGLTFHACRRSGALWKDPDPSVGWASVVAFDQPRQAFYQPAMGAVFLANYARRYGARIALEGARRLLSFNLRGSESQFTDLQSVQACKFGWAVGEMHLCDPAGGWLPWVRRMTSWFIDRQAPEGWWGPSHFANPEPSIADRLVKTSEHVMELTILMNALGVGGAGARESH